MIHYHEYNLDIYQLNRFYFVVDHRMSSLMVMYCHRQRRYMFVNDRHVLNVHSVE